MSNLSNGNYISGKTVYPYYEPYKILAGNSKGETFNPESGERFVLRNFEVMTKGFFYKPVEIELIIMGIRSVIKLNTLFAYKAATVENNVLHHVYYWKNFDETYIATLVTYMFRINNNYIHDSDITILQYGIKEVAV